jgi:virulence-associated protein VapD
MFAIAFDLVVADTLKNRPSASVREIRAFKIEHWSDFTSIVKT